MEKTEQICISANAETIQAEKMSASKLIMVRYEETFDFFSEEPCAIRIRQKSEEDESQLFGQIIRIRLWSKMGTSSCWSVYAQEREDFHNVVVKKVVWDMEKDKKGIKAHMRNRDVLLSKAPCISVGYQHISNENSKNLIDSIQDLDAKICNGIVLHKAESPTWEFRDLEVMRLFDWGQVHCTWCTAKKNDEIESKIKKLVECLDFYFSTQHTEQTIFEMTLVYESSDEDTPIPTKKK